MTSYALVYLYYIILKLLTTGHHRLVNVRSIYQIYHLVWLWSSHTLCYITLFSRYIIQELTTIPSSKKGNPFHHLPSIPKCQKGCHGYKLRIVKDGKVGRSLFHMKPKIYIVIFIWFICLFVYLFVCFYIIFYLASKMLRPRGLSLPTLWAWGWQVRKAANSSTS